MIVIDDILKIIKERNLNVSELSRNTGIPGTRIYKWLDGKGKPKGEDTAIMQEWAASNPELFPDFGSKDKEINVLKPEQILSVLASALDKQADAFKAQAEMMRSIEANMARQDLQKQMDTNLTLALTGIEALKFARDRADEREAMREKENPPLKGTRKTVRENRADGHKRGIHP